MADVLYSFGTSHPGAITLHNFPRFLQHFDRADGTLVDLASIDVLRVRERGVPRYNEFRRLLHLKAYDTFEEMADTPEHAEDLRRIYSDPEAGGHDDRDVRRAQAEGLRLQRHGVPDLHPDGLAATRERPLLHDRLPARDLHEGRHRLGRGQLDAHRSSSATSRSSSRAAGSRESRSRPGGAPARQPRRDRARARDPQPRPRQGRTRARLPARRRRRAHPRRHALRERRAARPRRDPQARPQARRPEADRDHARAPLAPRRPRRPEARKRRHGVCAPVGGRHRRRRPARAAGQHPAPPVAAAAAVPARAVARPPQARPVPGRRAPRRRRRVRAAAGAPCAWPLARSPRVLVARAQAS